MELTQTHFERIAHLFPKQRGNVSLSHLTVLDAILYVAEQECKWRGLPASFGSWHTIDTRMNRWAKAAVSDRVFAQLQRLDLIRVRVEVMSLDSTRVKVHPDGTGALETNGPQAIGKSRGGWSTKIHRIASDDRSAIGFSLSGGEAGDAPTRTCPAEVHEPVPDTDPSTSSLRVWNGPAAQSLRVALGCRPWERGCPARSGPQARHMGKRERRPRSRDITPRATRFGRESGRLGRVVLVGALRAFGPLRARGPRSQGHRTQGRPRRHCAPRAGVWPARACRSCRRFAGLRPVAGKMPALPGIVRLGRGCGRLGHVALVGALRAFGPLRASFPRPTSTALCASGGGVAGSGVSLLSALCGPSARCGQDARAPRDIAPKADLDGIVRLGRGCGRLGCVVPVGALRAFGPLRARCPRSQGHRTQGRPRRHCAPRAGVWPARGVVPVGALRAFGPLRARCPRSQGHRTQGRPRRHCAPRAGVWPARVVPVCGPSARCGQDARAPRDIAPKADLDGIVRLGRGCGRLGCVAPVGALRAFGPVRARCPPSQGHRSQGRASGGGVERAQSTSR